MKYLLNCVLRHLFCNIASSVNTFQIYRYPVLIFFFFAIYWHVHGLVLLLLQHFTKLTHIFQSWYCWSDDLIQQSAHHMECEIHRHALLPLFTLTPPPNPLDHDVDVEYCTLHNMSNNIVNYDIPPSQCPLHSVPPSPVLLKPPPPPAQDNVSHQLISHDPSKYQNVLCNNAKPMSFEMVF